MLDRGIGHIYIRPATPRLNGKVERSHRIDAEEFYRLLDGVVIDDSGLFNDKLQGMGELLQLPPTPRRPRRPNPLRKTATKDPGPACHRPPSVTQLAKPQIGHGWSG